jgi:RHS repeat-associated protein
VFALVVLFFCSSSLQAQYGYQRTITIDHTKVLNTDQANFPVLISGTYGYLATAANGGKVQNASGYDIIFAGDPAGAAKLDHEIESYDPTTGAINFWVRIPALSHTSDTVIYLLYGNSAITTSQENKASVWDGNYKGVWHFAGGASLNLNDSTSNGNNGTNSGATAAAGQIGGAASFNGSSQINIATSGALSGAFTIEAWAKPVGWNGYGDAGVYGSRRPQDASFDAQLTPSGVHGDIGTGGYWLTTGADAGFSDALNVWHHLVYAATASGYSIYADGVLKASGSLSAAPLLYDANHILMIGTGGYPGDTFNGVIDEVRVSSTARAADWIAAEYNNQSSPATFYAVGAEGNPSSLVSIALTPANPSVPQGTPQRFTATGTYSDGSTHDVSGLATWSSSQPAVATISNTGLAMTLAQGGSNITAAIGSLNVSTTLTVTAPVTYQRTIVIDHTKVANTDQADFPILISGTYSALATAANGGKVQNANGYDIVFTSDPAGTTKLDYEIESYDPTSGTINAWVRIPTLSHTTDTVIYLNYGNSAITTSQQNKAGVWDANYKGVWHLTGGTSVSAEDSTANQNNGTIHGAPTVISGQIAGAANLAGSGDNLGIQSIPLNGVDYTISSWFHTPLPGTGSWNTLTRGVNYDHQVLVHEGDWHLGAYSGGFVDSGFAVSSLPNGWHSLTASATASGTIFYVDGARVGAIPLKSNADVSFLGNYQGGGQQLGQMDEVRISTGIARSADWVATEYNNQSSPAAFYTVGSEGIAISVGLTPAMAALYASQTQQFTAPVTGTPNTAVTWTLSPSGVGSMDGTGLYTAPATISTQQTVTVTAASVADPTKSASATITLYPPYGPLVSIAVTPANSSISQGTNQQFTATGTFTDGSTQDLTASATWSSSATAVATINAAGLVAGVAPGNSTIKAASGTISGSTLLAVTSHTLPQVVQVQPADQSSGVPMNGRVVVRFAQPVQPAVVVNGTLTLLQGATNVAGNVVLSNDHLSLTFRPAQNLAATTVYTVVVQDVAGNQPAPLFQSGFTTGSTIDSTAPQVKLTSPQNGDNNVPINAPIQVQFTKPMDPATLTPQTITVTDSTSGQPVTGMVQVDASGLTASFVPSTLLGIQHWIYVSLGSGIQDTSGNSMSAPGFVFKTSFSSDNQAPNMLGVSPSSGATAVPLNALVVAEFDRPLNIVTASSGFQVQAGGLPVSGGIALSDGNKRVTFTPQGGFTADTTYTVAATAQITDVAGIGLVNPGTSTFTTGSASDTTQPAISTVTPSTSATGVPVNAIVQVEFTKPINPLTVTPGAFLLYAASTAYTNTFVAGTITVSADGMTATFTPSSPLAPSTYYSVAIDAGGGIADMEGHGIPGYAWSFTTGPAAATTLTVLGISPLNGATGVPVNPQVVVQVSAPVDVVSVSNSAITVTAAGTPVAGAITLSGDQTMLVFTPSAPLAAGTAYTVTAGGFTDLAGNQVVPFTSTFTTDSSGVQNTTTPAVVSISPANGATGVDVSSPIVLTFNEVLDPLSVKSNTIQVATGNAGLAGSYALDATGTVVTFTPLSPLPANTTILVQVNSSYYGNYYNPSFLVDLSGHAAAQYTATFTTGTGADTTPPTVIHVTPDDGMTGVGLNAPVALTFSKSLNPRTVTPTGSTITLWVNGKPLPSTAIYVSPDGRVVTLKPPVLPAASTVAVVATSGITDLFGNALVPFESQFTTLSNFDTDHPTVVNQRPGNSATGVPLNTSVVLYLSEPMNAASVQGALHISQNGAAVNGTVEVSGGGQVVEFTPSAPWQANAYVQVFLDTTAQDTDGISVINYSSSFTTAADPSRLAPAVVAVNPVNGANGVPTNTVFEIALNQPLNAATVNASTVVLEFYPSFTPVPSTVNLVNGGTAIQVVPNAPLAANASFIVQLLAGIQGGNGLALPAYNAFFNTGAGPDTVAPAIVSVSPPNGSVNVGDNAHVRVVFTKAVNPITVNAATIQITGGDFTEVPDSISFTDNNKNVLLVPHAPLPDNTPMTLTISGVTDVAGNAVPAQTIHFTTGTGPDVVAPLAISTNPSNGEAGVPLNAVLQFQANEPLDPGTVNSSTFTVYDGTLQQNLAGSYSLSSDGRTVTFLPGAPLGAGRSYTMAFVGGITDLAGNPVQCAPGLCAWYGGVVFTTGMSADASTPQVIGVSPANGLSGVMTNAQVVIQFNEPVSAEALGQVTLSAGGSAVNVSSLLSNGNQTLTLIPVAPLLPNTTYTVNVAGVEDLGGNPLPAPVASSFTTGAGGDLAPPFPASISPSDAATSVPTNVIIQAVFNKRINPFTVNANTFQVYASDANAYVTGPVTVSSDGLKATFVPTNPLVPFTRYTVSLSNGITDLAGQPLTGIDGHPTWAKFTTAQGPTTAETVLAVSPPDGTSGVPINPQVVVELSSPVNALTVGNSAITLSAGGSPVTGTVSASSDGTMLTFTTNALLLGNTSYTMTVSGFTDLAGNQVTPFTSTFKTSTSATGNGLIPAVVSVSPVNGAAAVPVNSNIVLTFNEPLNPFSVNAGSIQITATGINGLLAGAITLDASGTVVTFTPVSSLPPNTTVLVRTGNTYYGIGAVVDLSGHQGASFSSSFTTGSGADTTPPTVVNVTPNNGATGVGLDSNVVLTFSEALNPNTIAPNTVTLLVNGKPLSSWGSSISADNRVLTLKPYSLPASSLVSVVATGGLKDQAGNALVSFQSQFTTLPALDTDQAKVVAQRPGNGATGAPVTTSVVLYLSEPMDPATVPGALHVSQNGVLVNGATQVSDSGQVVQFTPASPWQKGAIIQVFLDSTAQDADGISVTSYQASFITAVDTSTLAPAVVSTNPGNVNGVPTNVVIDIGFNQPLDPATVNTSTVVLHDSNPVPSTVSLLNGGTIVQVVPAAPLAPNASYVVQLTTGLHGTNGIALPQMQNSPWFSTGAGPDTVAPTIVALSPPNGATNVGDNAYVHLVFSKPVNPLTVNGSTIQLAGGGLTEVPDSITFTNNNQDVLLVPHTPLPDATQMTLTIAGVTDVAGNPVAPQTTQFTTGTGPDLTAPIAISATPSGGQANVPTNAIIQIQANKPLDPGTINSNSFNVYDFALQQNVTGAYSLSADGRSVGFVPSAPLAASHTFAVNFTGKMADLMGNVLQCAPGVCNWYYGVMFTTGAGTGTNTLQVVGVSPANGLTGVATNAQVMVQFNEAVDAGSLGQVTLSTGGSAVNVTSSLTNGNQTLTLVPAALLQPNTAYTVTVTGVHDLAGNAMTAPVAAGFTTGTGADLIGPMVVSTSPTNQSTGVPLNTVAQVMFSKRINPLTLTTATMQLTQGGAQVAGTTAVSADGQTATFIPASPLAPSTGYTISFSGAIADLAGLGLGGNYPVSFTTGTAPTSAPSIAWINPSSAFVGTSVTISGFGFGSSPGSSTISFHGVQATPASWSDNEIVVPVPDGATTGAVAVTVNGTDSNHVVFEVLATPTITALSQNSGAVGTPITISGTNFGSSLDARQVFFNGVTVQTTSDNWTSTSVVAAVPDKATVGPVTVVINGVSSNADFIFTPINPVINSLLPATGGPGSLITIQGTGFGSTQGTSSVKFYNGVPATEIFTWSDTAIKVKVPDVTGGGPVTVTVAGVTSNGMDFNFEQLTISGIAPIAGSPGTSVTIVGTGFGSTQNDSTIRFNETAAAVTTWSDQKIVAVVSQGTTNGPVTVTVAGHSAQGGPYSVDFTALVTDSLGNQTSYKAAVAGGTWYVTDSSGSGCSSCTLRGANHYEYDSNGNVVAETNALGQTKTYTYDSNFNVTSESFGGATVSYTYNNFNEPLTVTDPLGSVTTNKYDAHGNLVSVTSPAPDANALPSVTQFAYDSKGELIQITDPLGNPTIMTYTPLGLIATIKDAQGNVTSYQYDAHGNRIAAIDALNNQTSFAYDASDRLTRITYPDQMSVSFGYDYRGRRTSITDQNGNATTYAYDDADRLISVTDAALNTTLYAYDTENNVVSITDADQHSTSLKYDNFGRVTETDFPSSLAETYTYDAIGNLTSRTDRKGQTIQYVYNALNRLNHIGYPDSTGVDYVYDLVGKIQHVNDPSGSYGFAYDNQGRLIGATTQYAFLPGRTFAVNYTYDAASHRKTMRDGENGLTTYSYDTLNRLKNIVDFNNDIFGYSYDQLSRRISLTRANGVNTSYTYDNLSRLLSVLHQAGGVTIDGSSYGLDAVGNRTSKTDQRVNVTTDYSYDKVYQLTEALKLGGANCLPSGCANLITEQYSYDAVGNRLSSLAMSYSYNPSNELISSPSGSYTYDANGSMLADPSGRSYAWDFTNRLTQVTLVTGGTVSFKYDPFGRRIQKSLVQGGTTRVTNYLYDGANIIEELDASGNTIAKYSQSLNMDQPLAMTRQGITSFYQQDAIGATTSLVDPSGTTTDTYTYDSFGNITASSGSTVNPFRYTGRELDAETGIYYYRARYYDPSIGRFLGEDPVRLRGGINFYTYVRNNPLKYADPRGLAAQSVPQFFFGVSGGIGGPRVAAFGEAGCGPVMDDTGHLGLLCCYGGGGGAIMPLGGFASVQGSYMFCPNCNSICDLQGIYVKVVFFGDLGGGIAGGAGVSTSNGKFVIEASGGPSVGEGVGAGIIAGECHLVLGGGFCKGKDCQKSGSPPQPNGGGGGRAF